jgi:hypothetical protein
MLKSGPGALSNNTYGPAVRTGSVSHPGPTPPFEASPLITNVSFGPVRWWNGSGDTWPTAWAPDGSVYGWCCDAANTGAFSPMSLWRLEGDPYSEDIVPALVAANPINYTALCADLGPTGPFPKINVKPGGMAALADGSLLVGVSCMNYGDDAVFNRQHNLQGFIGLSKDGGRTWTNATLVGAFAGRFSAPVFVSCGQGNAPCAAKDGGLLYVFFPGSFDNGAYWDNNDAMFLARVAEASVLDAAAYEFFSGLDGTGAPTWTTDAAQAQPSLQFGRMVGENAVSYNPYLQRYLVANFGFIDASGTPRPWHSKPYMSPHRTQLLFLEAENPWGPWRVFYRSDDSPPAPGLYTPTFPSAYMRPPVGSTAEMVLFFACLEGAPNCRYTLNYQTVVVTLSV